LFILYPKKYYTYRIKSEKKEDVKPFLQKTRLPSQPLDFKRYYQPISYGRISELLSYRRRNLKRLEGKSPMAETTADYRNHAAETMKAFGEEIGARCLL
jgi:hypothetical protein